MNHFKIRNAVVFVTGSQRFSSYGFDYGDGPYAFRNEGQIEVVGQAQNRPDRGLTIIATPPPPGRSTTLFLGDFEGSVYAPQSEVVVYANREEVDRMKEPSGWNNGPNGHYFNDEMDTPEGFVASDAQFKSVKSPKRELGFVIGKDVRIGKVHLDFMHKKKKSKQDESSSFTPNVLSWTQ
ncbi:MAG: hypothetical protein COV75_09110 [Candidatus Omnitrophica bacterium CG11_big_fil_rev_8_21_14_0_20_63_9]|nr:MAG: hypothetical protein COV75_09110 [Candidatus Omnitrophica bacterium CG11_big_fil_rev_8_21_14_0_20_63_9]